MRSGLQPGFFNPVYALSILGLRLQHLLSAVPEAALKLFARLMQFLLELGFHLLFFRLTAGGGLKSQGFLPHFFLLSDVSSHLPAFRQADTA